ncbi:glycosyltransferase family 2 protein [Pseudoalteromonas piscicida]|uniref:glycosyltransferase family 2 protein n=1 Tax=Pseudoalteromonas piscicida TaxID=43662 RepID=UPI0032C114B5
MKVALIIPTYNGGKLFEQVLQSIKKQSLTPDELLIIDSSSSDETVSIATSYGFKVHSISQSEFDHGGTRNLALTLVESDVVIYMTQDAILADEKSFKKLVSIFSNNDVSAAYGRQLPHDNANTLARHTRFSNYGEISYIANLDSESPVGFKKAFMSNSFAAYRNSALGNIGGFPKQLILGEDSYVAAKFLLGGSSVAYVADALAYHSHNYSVSEEFKRYFDIGVFHSTQSWMLDSLGKVEGEGIKFAVGQVKYALTERNIYQVIRSLFTSLAKFTGYKMGLFHKSLPLTFNIKLSMYKGYFIRLKERDVR